LVRGVLGGGGLALLRQGFADRDRVGLSLRDEDPAQLSAVAFLLLLERFVEGFAGDVLGLEQEVADQGNPGLLVVGRVFVDFDEGPEVLREGRVVPGTLVSIALDVVEHLADGVDHLQERGRDLGPELHHAVAQTGEDVLSLMRQLLELVEREESARALDRVDRAEDSAEQQGIIGRALVLDEILVELVEILAALHEKLGNQFLILVHRDSSTRCATPGRAV